MSRNATLRTTSISVRGFAVSGSFWANTKEVIKNITINKTNILALSDTLALIIFFITSLFVIIKKRRHSPYTSRFTTNHN